MATINKLTINNAENMECKLGAALTQSRNFTKNLNEMHAYFNELTVNDKLQVTQLKQKVQTHRTISQMVHKKFDMIKSKFKKHAIYCDFEEDFVYQNMRDRTQYRLLPNCRTNSGRYYHSNDVYVNPNLTFVPHTQLPPEIINDFKFGIQLGVEYSSNNAGDGPAVLSKICICLYLFSTGVTISYWPINIFQYFMYRKCYIQTYSELFVYLESKIRKLQQKYEIRNTVRRITKKKAVNSVFYMDSLSMRERYSIMFIVSFISLLILEQIVHCLGHENNFTYYVNIFFFQLVFTLLLRFVLSQLGVEYTSNNAGDGPSIDFPLQASDNEYDIYNKDPLDGYPKKFIKDGVEYEIYSQEQIDEIQRKAKQGQKIVGTAFAAGAAYIAFTKSQMCRDFIKEKNAFSLVESIGFFLYDLQQCNSKAGLIIPVYRFARTHYNGDLVEDFVAQIQKCIEQLFPMPLQTDDDDEDEDNVFTKMRHYLDDYDSFRNSPLFKKVYKLIMYMLAYTIFRDKECSYESFGYSALEAAAFKNKYHAGPDLIYTVLDTVSFLCEKGFQIYKEGYSSSIFHDSTRYKKFYDDCEKVKLKARHMNQLEALDENAFLNKLDALIEKGKDICKCKKSMGKFEAEFVARYVADMTNIKHDILSFRGASRTRSAPFAILLNGNSGIGKSTLIRIIIAHFCKVKGLDNDDSYIYTRNPAEKYWNNFRTYMHTIIGDDLSFRNPNLGDPASMDEIIQIVNDISFTPDQASLEDKGRIPFRAKLFVASTNIKNLNAHHYCACPSAVQRRLKYVVTPSVRKEYRHASTGMLDPSQTPPLPEDEYEDLWTFTVEIVIPSPIRDASTQQLATFQKVLVDASMPEFIQWLVSAIHLHDKDQVIVSQAVEHTKQVKVCELCYMPKANCKCLQSVDTELIYFAYLYVWMMFFKQGLYIILIHLCNVFGIQGWFSQIAWRCMTNPAFARIVFDRAGAQAAQRFRQPKVMLSLAATISLVIAAYKIYRSTKTIHGANQSKDSGHRPSPSKHDDTTEAVWYKDEFELTTADVTRATLSSKGLPFEQLTSILLKNCASIVVERPEGKERKSKIFAIGGQVYITNNHCLPTEGNLSVELTQTNSSTGVNSNIRFTLSQQDIFRKEDHDVCCFIIRCLPPRKILTQYFCEDSFAANTHAFYISKTIQGCDKIMKVNNIKKKNNMHILALGKNMDVWTGFVSPGEATQMGDCGSILLAKSELGYCIVGIHMSGEEDVVVAKNVSRSLISEFVEFGKQYLIGANPPLMQSQNEHPIITPLHSKSTMRYIRDGNANTYGSISGHRAQHKSRVEPTIIAEIMQSKYDYATDCGKPVFTWVPWRNGALDSLNIPNNIDTVIVDKCVNSFLKDILTSLTNDDLQKVHKYDLFTVVNGAHKVNYVDKIKRNTSAGHPFNRSKKYYMKPIPPQHNLMDPVEVDGEIMQVYEEMLERYQSGDRAGCVFTAHLKDEALPQRKILAGKTRVFSGANLPWTMLVRKYFLSCVRVIQENQQIFESGPGLVAQTSEWEQLYQYLIRFGKHKIVAGDYGKFDKRMSAIFILGAFKILIEICRHSGNYDEEDVTVLRGISYDVAFAYQNYNGDLIEFFGSNPSGHPLTVIINGLVNSLYQRYAYYQLNPKKECDSFKSKVNLMTYGDDNICGVSDEIPWFNHTAISESLAEIGVVYTMADKEAESKPYIDISESSFLKRSWRYDENTKTHLATLDPDSIIKSLTIWVRSKSITAEEQIIDIIGSANDEYFFYGKEVYERKQIMFRDIIKLHGLGRYIKESTLPSYDSLLVRYFDRSRMNDQILA